MAGDILKEDARLPHQKDDDKEADLGALGDFVSTEEDRERDETDLPGL